MATATTSSLLAVKRIGAARSEPGQKRNAQIGDMAAQRPVDQLRLPCLCVHLRDAPREARQFHATLTRSRHHHPPSRSFSASGREFGHRGASRHSNGASFTSRTVAFQTGRRMRKPAHRLACSAEPATATHRPRGPWHEEQIAMEHDTGAAGPPETLEPPATGEAPATGEPPETLEPPATGEPRVDAALSPL